MKGSLKSQGILTLMLLASQAFCNLAIFRAWVCGTSGVCSLQSLTPAFAGSVRSVPRSPPWPRLLPELPPYGVLIVYCSGPKRAGTSCFFLHPGLVEGTLQVRIGNLMQPRQGLGWVSPTNCSPQGKSHALLSVLRTFGAVHRPPRAPNFGNPFNTILGFYLFVQEA